MTIPATRHGVWQRYCVSTPNCCYGVANLAPSRPRRRNCSARSNSPVDRPPFLGSSERPLSFAQLRIGQDRLGDAQELLAPVYSRFTEGFGTSDLQSARAILESLQ